MSSYFYLRNINKLTPSEEWLKDTQSVYLVFPGSVIILSIGLIMSMLVEKDNEAFLGAYFAVSYLGSLIGFLCYLIYIRKQTSTKKLQRNVYIVSVTMSFCAAIGSLLVIFLQLLALNDEIYISDQTCGIVAGAVFLGLLIYSYSYLLHTRKQTNSPLESKPVKTLAEALQDAPEQNNQEEFNYASSQQTHNGWINLLGKSLVLSLSLSFLLTLCRHGGFKELFTYSAIAFGAILAVACIAKHFGLNLLKKDQTPRK